MYARSSSWLVATGGVAMTRPFDFQVSVVECPNCGAPVSSELSRGQVNCSYCNVAILIRRSARPGGGMGPVAPAAAQSAAAAEEGRYDSRQLLKRLDIGLDYGEIRAAFNEARGRILAGRAKPQDEYVVWAGALFLAPKADAAGDQRAHRAVLETALQTVPDPGYQAILCCRLARAAAQVGDTGSAEGWIAAATIEHPVAEVTTEQLVARAWVKLHAADYQGALAIIGRRHGDVSLSRSGRVIEAQTRIHALERLGELEAARQEFKRASRSFGKRVLLGWLTRHGLAPRIRARPPTTLGQWLWRIVTLGLALAVIIHLILSRLTPAEPAAGPARPGSSTHVR